jgi:hypothetical protein
MSRENEKETNMSSLQEFKAAMEVGIAVDVTNHYLTRQDHPCFLPVRRTVTTSNSASYGFSTGGKQRWPKVSQVRGLGMGVFGIYGYPNEGDLFLTITIVKD